MSAYIVHPDTIDYLIAAAQKYGEVFYAPLPESTPPDVLAATPVDYVLLALITQYVQHGIFGDAFFGEPKE